MKKKLIIVGLVISCIAYYSCDDDKVQPNAGCETIVAKYQSSDPDVSSVKEIIDQTCSYSGCHDGVGGIGPRDYTTYEGMLRHLESGSFADRVITQRDNPALGMPPDASVYQQSLQDSLSSIQLEIITCWLQEGFPK